MPIAGAVWAKRCDGLLEYFCNDESLRSIESKVMSRASTLFYEVTSYHTIAIYLKVSTVVELLTAIAGTVLWSGILVFPGILSNYSA
jgi:hypothetical protein